MPRAAAARRWKPKDEQQWKPKASGQDWKEDWEPPSGGKSKDWGKGSKDDWGKGSKHDESPGWQCLGMFRGLFREVR